MAATVLLSGAALYLASSSKGVSAHLVVRVVVTALESVPPDTAESSDSSRNHRSRILKPVSEKTAVENIRWEGEASEVKKKLSHVYIWHHKHLG